MNEDRTAAESESGVGPALDRVFRASQRVLIDRIDLVLLEIQQLMARGFLGVIALAVAAGLVLGGWFSLMALVILLADASARPMLLGIVGVANLAIGAGLVRLAASYVQAPKLIMEPEPSGARPRETASAAGGGVH
jgi:uncharacterized membrane protein YqjE